MFCLLWVSLRFSQAPDISPQVIVKRHKIKGYFRGICPPSRCFPVFCLKRFQANLSSWPFCFLWNVIEFCGSSAKSLRKFSASLAPLPTLGGIESHYHLNVILQWVQRQQLQIFLAARIDRNGWLDEDDFAADLNNHASSMKLPCRYVTYWILTFSYVYYQWLEILPLKKRKSRQNRFRDKTAYAWASDYQRSK